MPDDSAAVLTGLGALLLLGLATDFLGRATRLPRVTLLMPAGVALGADGLGLIPARLGAGFPLVGDMALLIVGFLLGGRLTRETLAAHGREVLWISGSAVLVTALVVAGGLAERFELSFLLAAMTLGATVANLARHHERPFHQIEDIEWPFLILFFVLTGAALDLDGAGDALGLTALYIVLRTGGRALGAFAGARAAGADPVTCRWMGLALLPQAGVANGMALVAGNAFPPLRDTLLAVTILATIVFELGGPLLTRHALGRAGALDPPPP